MLGESADEFEIIRTLFAPLATHPGARALADDVAVIEIQGQLAATTDAIIEGVHFLAADPIETIAMKALRVNISDLVAKGVRPTGALLTLAWPQTRPASDIEAFAAALGRDLKHFGVALLGGDTTASPGPLMVSMTVFGTPLGARVPARADAKPGEDLWLVGGEIGSAWLGLQLRTGKMSLQEIRRGRAAGAGAAESAAMAVTMPPYLTLPGEEFDAEAAWLMSSYLAPFVRLESADIVARFAGASMDISDGLAADAAKLAQASDVALLVEANEIPFSIPAQRWVQTGGDFRELVTGGDDYVVLFTAAPEAREAIVAAEAGRALRLTRIGRVAEGAGAHVLDRAGAPVAMARAGYAHTFAR